MSRIMGIEVPPEFFAPIVEHPDSELCKRIQSLEREYLAYHTDNDYWRGIRYVLDVIGKEGEK